MFFIPIINKCFQITLNDLKAKGLDGNLQTADSLFIYITSQCVSFSHTLQGGGGGVLLDFQFFSLTDLAANIYDCSEGFHFSLLDIKA